MKIRVTSILFLLLFLRIGYAQKNRTALFFPAVNSFSVANIQNGSSAFITPAGKTFYLFVFMSPECPLCQNYSATIQSIQEKYKQHLQVYAIVPGNTYDAATIASFKQKYKVNFDFFADTSLQLTKYLQATVTPEVLLLNTNMQLIYSGAIDNWAIALGKKRVKTTEFYLVNAIENTLHQQPVSISHTNPVGCKINDY